MNINYLYQRTGGRYYNWQHGAARSSTDGRAGETRSLSGYIATGDSAVIRPGEPEPLTGVGGILPDLGPAASFLAVLAMIAGGLWIADKVTRGKSSSTSSRAGYKSNPGTPIGIKRLRSRAKRRKAGTGTRRRNMRRRQRDRYKRWAKRKPKGGHLVAHGLMPYAGHLDEYR